MSDVVTSAPATTQAEVTATSPDAQEASAASGAEGQAASTQNGQEPQAQGEAAAEQAFALKLPENALLDASHVEDLALFAKELGLKPEQAQAQLEREHTLFADLVEAQAQAKDEQTKAWFEEVKNDRELGGEAFKENAEFVRRAVETFFDKETRAIFDQTGLGNHPGLFRGFLKLSKLIANDKLVQSSNQVSGEKSAAELLYGPNKN